MTPNSGQWDIFGDINFNFYKPATITAWAVVSVGNRRYDKLEEEARWVRRFRYLGKYREVTDKCLEFRVLLESV